MSGDTKQGLVDIVHGVFAHSLPLAGETVAWTRAELAGRMGIDADAVAFVDGKPVDEATVLAAGQVLNFVKHTGEMG